MLNMTLDEYNNELKSIFASCSNRSWYDWKSTGILCDRVSSLLGMAKRDMFSDGRDVELFELSCKAFIKWSKAELDDSNGETQYVAGIISDIWDEIYQRQSKSIDHDTMLRWFLKNLNGSVIDYMEDCLYDFVGNHFDEPNLLEEKYQFLERKIESASHLNDDGWKKTFTINRCRLAQFDILAKQQKPIEMIRAFAETISWNEAKEHLAEIELVYGYVEKAINIYKDLIFQNAKNDFEATKYRVRLKDIYKSQEMTEDYISLLKELILSNLGNMSFYHEYKELYAEDEWPDKRDELFALFPKGNSGADGIYHEEGRLDLLMDNIEVANDSWSLKRYEKELFAKYPERCILLLVQEADKQVVRADKRSRYRYLADTIKLIKRCPGGKEIADGLIHKYCAMYPRRSAMIEELRGI